MGIVTPGWFKGRLCIEAEEALLCMALFMAFVIVAVAVDASACCMICWSSCSDKLFGPVSAGFTLGSRASFQTCCVELSPMPRMPIWARPRWF